MTQASEEGIAEELKGIFEQGYSLYLEKAIGACELMLANKTEEHQAK